MGLALILAACGSDSNDNSSSDTAAGGATSGTGGSGDGCTVGVSWNNYQEERWAKFDEPAIKAAIEAGGGKYISNDAKSSAETQASNVENLISQGAKVLIILAQDGTAIKPSVASAIQNGVPVIAYDRLIEDPKALYITFDNVEVGKMQAEEIFKAVPKGNYVIIKGNKADANADFLRSGYDEVIRSAVDSGDIKIVGETYTDNWDPSKAQTEMEQFLTANDNKVDAVLSENDGMAGGVVAALQGPGPRRQGAGVGSGRRSAGAQPRRTRHPDGRRLEGRPRARQDRRRSRRPALQGPGCIQGQRHQVVHDPRWHRRVGDPADAAADHEGQPRRRDRRRLDHQGERLQGRDGRFRRGLLTLHVDNSQCTFVPPARDVAGGGTSTPRQGDR